MLDFFCLVEGFFLFVCETVKVFCSVTIVILKVGT